MMMRTESWYTFLICNLSWNGWNLYLMLWVKLNMSVGMWGGGVFKFQQGFFPPKQSTGQKSVHCEKAIIFHNANQFHPIRRQRVRWSVPFRSSTHFHFHAHTHTHTKTLSPSHTSICAGSNTLQGQNVKESNELFHCAFRLPHIYSIYTQTLPQTLMFSCSHWISHAFTLSFKV